MKLQEIKTILIEKFFNEIKTGVTLEESLILVQAAASLISESAGQKTKSIIEDLNPFPIEAQSPTKAFDLFSNGTFNTLMAIDESEILPKIVYIAVKEYRNCMHINCTAGSPVPSETNAGGVKIAMIELKTDLGIEIAKTGDLTKWAEQGVLLLNSVLTVKQDTPASHKGIGWEPLTDYIIRKLNSSNKPIVFILWGNFAKSKKVYITNPKHLIIESAHPSPFSANYGFFGSRPFSRTNTFLEQNKIQPIDWKL